MTTSSYTEADAEVYYDEKDDLYKQCWAADGTTHWGFFPDGEGDDLQKAGWLWSSKILEKSGITKDSRVLEIGCGNGAVALWLAEQTGCSVVGIDISSTRINNANKLVEAQSELDVKFVCGSVTDLPYDDNSFTHVWGQGVLYHIPDLDKALAEISRVLTPQGVALIDDFVRPEDAVSITEPVQVHFYERLKFDAKYTHDQYQAALRHLRLMPVEAIDMGVHIARTYDLVVQAAESVDQSIAETFRACGAGVRTQEVMGYFYRCTKVPEPVKWVYDSKSSKDVTERYDAWAPDYDRDMANRYDSPERATQQLVQHVGDQNTLILDVGCGTGLVGQALSSVGYTSIHGIDISQQMLALAEKKNCYERLSQHDLSSDPDVGLYPAIITVGCLTFGHVPGYALCRLFSWLKPGGVLQVTVRKDFAEQDLYFEPLLKGLRWEQLDEASWKTHDGDQQVVGFILKKQD